MADADWRPGWRGLGVPGPIDGWVRPAPARANHAGLPVVAVAPGDVAHRRGGPAAERLEGGALPSGEGDDRDRSPCR